MATAEFDVEQAARILRSTESISAELPKYATKEDLSALATKVDGLDDRMGGLEVKVDGLDDRVGGLEVKVDGLETRMGSLEMGMVRLETKVDGLDDRMGDFESRMGRLETRMDGLAVKTNDIITSVRVLDNTVQLSLRYMRWGMGILLVLLIALLGVFGTLVVRILFYL